MSYLHSMACYTEGIRATTPVLWRGLDGLVSVFWQAEGQLGAKGYYLSPDPRIVFFLDDVSAQIRVSNAGDGIGRRCRPLARAIYVPAGVPMWTSFTARHAFSHLDLHVHRDRLLRFLSPAVGRSAALAALRRPVEIQDAPAVDALARLLIDEIATPRKHGIYAESLVGEPDFNDHDVDRKSITAMLSHDFGTGLSLNANLRYSDLTDDFGYVYLYDFEGRTGTTLGRYYYGQDGSADELIGNAILKYDTSFGGFDSSTLAGLEFRDASTDDTSFYGAASSIDIANPVYSGGPTDLFVYSTAKRDYRTKSAFLTHNLSFDDRIVATVGVRRDWLDLSQTGRQWNYEFSRYDSTDGSDDFSETSLRGALTYKVTPEISTYISYVESVAPPDVGVEPERGEQYEIGVKYQPAGTNALISASVYDLKQENITVAEVQDTGNIVYRTVGKTRVRGFDLEGKAELADNLSLLASYSYMDSEYVNDPAYAGNQFTAVPNHLASLWVDYTVPGNGARGDMTFGMGARCVGTYYFNGANTGGKSKATTLLDLAFSYQVQDDTDLTLHVSNLLDEQHVVGTGTADYYNPGRSVQASLRHRW